MRAVHLLAVSAALLLGANLASVDRAQAQGLLEMAPPADSSARTVQPRYEDVKFETDVAQAPKVGSAIFLNRGVLDVLMPGKKGRKAAASGIKAK